MEKSIHKQKEKFSYLFVRERGEREIEREGETALKLL